MAINTDKITALVAALTNKFEEKINKVTSWSSTTSDTNYPSEKLVKDSLDSLDSAKQDVSSKVTSFSTTTTDAQYPSAKLVQDQLGLKENAANKVTSWSAETSDTNYPSEKLVKDSLDDKLDADSVPTKTSDLTNDGDGTNPFLTTLAEAGGIVSIETAGTPDTGFAATYNIKQGDGTTQSLIGKINIPKDLLLQSASIETVGAEPNTLESANNLTTGDSYIKLIANTVDGDNAQTPLVIPISDIFDLQRADESTITLSNGLYSVKASGIDTTQLKDNAVKTAKINDSAVTTAKINDGAVTSDKIATAVKNSWLTTSQVDSEIDAYIDALTTTLNPPAQQAGE